MPPGLVALELAFRELFRYLLWGMAGVYAVLVLACLAVWVRQRRAVRTALRELGVEGRAAGPPPSREDVEWIRRSA